MKMEIRLQIRLFLIFLFLGFSNVFCQKNDDLKSLVTQNNQLLMQNLDLAYSKINPLLKLAIEQNDQQAELKLLDQKCKYYYQKNQIDKLIDAGQDLLKKSEKYQDTYTQVMANIYLAEAFSMNGFYDVSIKNLNNALAILRKDSSKSLRNFYAKANVLSSFANVYSDKGEPGNAIKKLKEAINSYDELEDKEEVAYFQYTNYSNISSLYTNINLDSAAYFANASIKLKPKNSKDDRIMMMNYFVLGKVYEDQNLLDKALVNYQKAIDLSEITGVELNLKEVYKSLVAIYNKSEKSDSAILYENKLKELEISTLQSKYNSLHKQIINKELGQKDDITNNIIYLIVGILLVIFLVLLVLSYFHKKRVKENQPENMTISYEQLVDLAKENNPSFMVSFENVFPTFTENLLKINPELTKTEIEFCALLKLNLSTKQIAQYTFIEPRTVQNKKYRIRKRLNIPQTTDIYNWFNVS